MTVSAHPIIETEGPLLAARSLSRRRWHRISPLDALLSPITVGYRPAKISPVSRCRFSSRNVMEIDLYRRGVRHEIGRILILAVNLRDGITLQRGQPKGCVTEIGAANRHVSGRPLAPQFHPRPMVW